MNNTIKTNNIGMMNKSFFGSMRYGIRTTHLTGVFCEFESNMIMKSIVQFKRSRVSISSSSTLNMAVIKSGCVIIRFLLRVIFKARNSKLTRRFFIFPHQTLKPTHTISYRVPTRYLNTPLKSPTRYFKALQKPTFLSKNVGFYLSSFCFVIISPMVLYHYRLCLSFSLYEHT